MEEQRGLVGLEARAADGTEVGRITEVVSDEETGGVTHVVVELEGGDLLEVPITSVSLDAEADFATFHADRSDVEPGDHVGDEEEPEGDRATDESDREDYEHEGQFVAEPESPEEAQAAEDLRAREDWQDEENTPDSGYPRNDAYVDPQTGEVEVDPLIEETESLAADVGDLLADTGLSVLSAEDGVVELTGSAAAQGDLEDLIAEIMGLDEVQEVDATDVEVGG